MKMLVLALCLGLPMAAQAQGIEKTCLFGRCDRTPKTDPAVLAILQQLASGQQQILSRLSDQQAQLLALLQQRNEANPPVTPAAPVQPQYIVHLYPNGQQQYGGPQSIAPSPASPQMIAPSPVAPQIIIPSPVPPQIIYPSPVAPQIVSPSPTPPQVVPPASVTPQQIAPAPGTAPPQQIVPGGTPQRITPTPGTLPSTYQRFTHYTNTDWRPKR